MSDQNPTLKDIWRLLGVMNRRFDASERQMVLLREEMGSFKAELRDEMGSFKTELRDEMGSFKTELREELGSFKTEMREEMGSFKAELREEMGSFKAEIKDVVERFQGQVAGLQTQMASGFGALKQSIEARDFRLDEHGRRLSELESSRGS